MISERKSERETDGERETNSERERDVLRQVFFVFKD